MPTYEYECPAGHRYEKREGFDAPATQRCAQCRRTARRVLSAPSILFKGSGFYITDSRKPAPADSASESTSDGKGESTSDAKPDGKPDAKADGKPDAKPAAAPEKPAASSSEKPSATPTKDAKPAAAS
jgi:putative FmdB family regulatory protein